MNVRTTRQLSFPKGIIFVCPKCKNILNWKKTLFCGICKESYDQVEEIPVLIRKSILSLHHQDQINYFENENINPQGDLLPWQKSYLNRFLSVVPNVNNRSILDIGSGGGYMSLALSERDARVVSSDITLKNLLLVNKAAKMRNLLIDTCCCVVEELPFPDNSFDIIIANAILEHIEKEADAIKEIKRVTKNNGIVMLTLPLKYKYLFPLMIPINYIYDKKIGHLRRYELNDIKMKFSDWKLLKVYYTGHLLKALALVVNGVIPIFNEKDIEGHDNKQISKLHNASNLIVFIQKP